MFVGGRVLFGAHRKVETIIKTRQTSHGLIMTRQKGHCKNNVHEKGKRELTLLDRWTCANGKE
jgi:hypothetical protein